MFPFSFGIMFFGEEAEAEASIKESSAHSKKQVSSSFCGCSGFGSSTFLPKAEDKTPFK
jgi:hypothetical protein